jgi:hypothetical protein
MAGCEASASARWLSFVGHVAIFFELNTELTSERPITEYSVDEVGFHTLSEVQLPNILRRQAPYR